jgi:hypothetical protein
MDTQAALKARLLLAHLTALADSDAISGCELRAALRDAAGRSGVRSADLVPALLDLLSRRGADTMLGRVLVATLLAQRQQDVLALLRTVPAFWHRFFSRFADDAPGPALAWFTSGWSPDGAHRGGAAALSRWALSHRHTGAWSCLRWTGHSQSPVVCASKPATFCELDTRASLAAIMKCHAGNDFVSSRELWDELLTDGRTSIVDADPAFFQAELVRLLDDARSGAAHPQLMSLLSHALAQQSLATLVQRALPCISDEDLVRLLPVFEATSAGGTAPGALLAGAPFAGVRWRSALHAGLAAALARSGGSMLRSLVRDRSQAGVPDAQAAWACITQLLATPQEEVEAGMPPVSAGTSAEEARLRVLLRSWLLRMRLADSTASQLEAHMDARGIAWRRDTPALLDEGRGKRHKRRRRELWEDGGEEASVVAMWRCDLDDWAMLMDAHALATLLADAAADELLRVTMRPRHV